MRLLDGDYCLPRQGGVSYAAQTPWLEAKTIRENILFGSAYEEKRYEAVVEASGLRQDLENLDAGDQTEIGERGTTLSGGQKARISLARAVYAPAQTVLLDDILSALDANTSKLVAEKCIKGDVLAGRTVVLVTHQYILSRPKIWLF
jgi:ABC-type multidrug transport system fused ATPase/permease subunit